MKWIRKALPYFAMMEGASHFVFSTFTLVGLVIKHDYDWVAFVSPIADYLMGIGTFLFGWLIKEEDEEDGEENSTDSH